MVMFDQVIMVVQMCMEIMGVGRMCVDGEWILEIISDVVVYI